MTRTFRLRLLALTGVASLAAGAGSAYADQSSTITVGATVINGTRTLNVKDVTGAAISSLTLGAGHGGALLVNVTDVNYAHTGYQVTATMSNLYPYSSGNYQFGQTPIPSSAVAMSFPGSLFDVANLSTLVTPLVHLTDSTGLFALANLDATVTGTTNSVSTLATVTQKAASSVLNELPVRVSTGAGGAFTNPAAVTGQSGTFNPTAVDVLDGTSQSLGELLTDLINKLNTGVVTAQNLVDDGLLDQNSVLAAAASALGLTPDQLSGAQITSILNGVSATVSDLQPLTALGDKVLGQTGSYNTVPQLSLTLPAQQPAGTYQGELTLTLMDK